ncbi:hypothetical protein MtrunA17_Chr3g0107171 [Medicago truncatula]|uniref:Uncharacterized protein n=1 Tax=Medicago truncatula TaxID=3880 RepID=A0A396IV33_MEDTR|nr:hypothetical protein MtrunA17_Chr3g0107171 [Medicago truncatula]
MLTSSQEYGDGQIAIPFFPTSTTDPLTIEDFDIIEYLEITQTNNDQGEDFWDRLSFLNEDAFKKESLMIQEQFPIASQFASKVHFNNFKKNIKESENQSIQYCATSEKTAAATFSTILGTRNEPPIQIVAPKPKGFPYFSYIFLNFIDVRIEVNFQIKLTSNCMQCVEEGNTLTNADAASPSAHLELVSSSQEQDVDVRGFQKITKTNNDQSQILRNNFLRMMILEIQNLSHLLPTAFLCLLRDTSLSTRYKCYAYTCLADLLQFLQTHSVLDVLGSSHSEFVKLLHNLRSFGFDKDWLDSVERRALFSDIKVSQDALQKLLDSKQQVSKEVEVLRLKIDILSQHVEDLKHQLTTSETVLKSIIQEEAQVLETKATFIAPLGY